MPSKNEKRTRLEKEYLTPREVAHLTGRSIFTVYHWLDQGKVRGDRQGRLRYVERKSLVEFLGKNMAKVCGII